MRMLSALSTIKTGLKKIMPKKIIEKAEFIEWAMTTQNLKKSTCETYWFYHDKRTNKNYGRANALYNKFLESKESSENKLQQTPAPTIEGLTASLKNARMRLERRNKHIALLQSKLDDIKSQLDTDYILKSDVNTRIEQLSTDNTAYLKRIEYLQTAEGYNKKKLNLLQNLVKNRNRIIVITFIDGSTKGFPSNLQFIQIEEVIKNQQISGISIIDIDWEIK